MQVEHISSFPSRQNPHRFLEVKDLQKSPKMEDASTQTDLRNLADVQAALNTKAILAKKNWGIHRRPVNWGTYPFVPAAVIACIALVHAYLAFETYEQLPSLNNCTSDLNNCTSKHALFNFGHFSLQAVSALAVSLIAKEGLMKVKVTGMFYEN